jgi:hypothetical protein
LVSAAEFEARAAPSFRERQAGPNEFLDVLLEVKAQLVIEFIFEGVAVKQRTQPS